MERFVDTVAFKYFNVCKTFSFQISTLSTSLYNPIKLKKMPLYHTCSWWDPRGFSTQGAVFELLSNFVQIASFDMQSGSQQIFKIDFHTLI